MTLIPLAEVELEFLIEESVLRPCDTDDCEERAAWYLRCEGCSEVTLSCEKCRLAWVKWLAENPSYSIWCLHCNTEFQWPIPWLPL